MVYHPLSRLVPLFIQQRYDTNPAVRSTSSQKIYLLCLSGVEGLLSEAQKPLNDHVTNLQLKADDPSGATPLRDRQTCRHFGPLLFITNNDVFVLLIVLLHLFPFLGKRHTDMVFLLILDILVTSRHALTTDRLGKVAFLPRKKAVVT